MRTAVAALSSALLVLVSCQAGSHDGGSRTSETTKSNPVADPTEQIQYDVMFTGRVTNVEIVTGIRKKWKITATVDKVEVGSLSVKNFSFVVHSPANSGIELGKTIRVRAKRVESGFEVDDLQWMAVE